ncbi:MAG: stage II sporulation protein M [Eubacteriales bacterium]|nr:stage II sporulation protein M [Eubacteriales bacterium]
MGKRISHYEIKRFPAWQIFLIGFFLGTLLPNVMWKMEWRQQTMASVYLLGTFAGQNMEAGEYFREVLRRRGSYFLLSAFCGISVFGVPLAVLGIFMLGAEIGMLLTISILQFGLSGGAVGVGLLFPQYLVYLPVLFYLLSAVYRQSMEIWKNRGLFPRKAYQYGIRILLAGIFYFGGVLLEVYINPWVTETIIKSLNIF